MADPNHPLNIQLAGDIEKVEHLLSNVDQDAFTHRNGCDGMSDENGSVASSADCFGNFGSPFLTTYGRTHSTAFGLESTVTLRKESRPSPERLDAQIRRLEATKNEKIERVLEQNRTIMEQVRIMVDEFKVIR